MGAEWNSSTSILGHSLDSVDRATQALSEEWTVTFSVNSPNSFHAHDKGILRSNYANL